MSPHEVRCPAVPLDPSLEEQEPSDLIGCGSTNVVKCPDEIDLYDCLDCGLFFRDYTPNRRTA